MRKFFTLFFTLLIAVQGVKAQFACSANFTQTFQNSPNTVRFIPAFFGDSVNTTHSWSFGDGNSSNAPSPIYSYQAAGSYTVTHIVAHILGPNNICRDTVIRTIVIQSVCNLTPSFSFIVDTSNNSTSGRTVYFQNTSTPYNFGDSVRWSFGDGTSAGGQNVNHTYTQSGIYNVCMRIIQRVNGALTSCVREVCQTVVIGSSCNLQAYFTFNPTSQTNTFQFLNNSVNMQPGDTVRWTFGDGTTGTGNNITHTYTQPGLYLVCIRVKRATPAGTAPCVSEYCDSMQVGSTNPCNLTPTFTAVPANNSINTFLFTNTTQGLTAADTIRWFFGDGASSTDANPTHTYSQGGVYRICLVIKTPSIAAGTPPCVREYCQMLTVIAPCSITPSFTHSADSSNAFRISFSNQTVAPIAGAYYLWTFGDGTSATGPNPVHLYRNPGSYRVCLRVQTSNTCSATSCDTIIVNSGGCYINAEFGQTRMSASTLTYQFRPRMIDSTWTYSWSFGDNSSSTSISPAHTYSQAGTYTVCLTVTRSPGCSTVFCRMINVYPALNCDSISVSYTYRNDPYMPNKVYFFAVANYPVLSQTWTITRLGSASTIPPVTLYRSNPVYYFQDTGYYHVCLRAYTMGGCIKDTCEVIYISQVATPPNPCYLQVYPNPASSYINLSLSLNQPQTVYVQIINSMNMVVKQRTYSGAAGGNTYSIYVGDLMPGTYNVRVVYGNSVCYSRFMKL